MLFLPPIYEAVQELSGDVLQASRRVDESGVSYADLATASTKAEVTRWFGTATMHHLFLAQMVTSGTDWGFGILPFGDHWVCSSTLCIN